LAKVLLLTLFKRERNYQVGPPLGLLYLGAVLRDAGHEVRLLDLRARQESIENNAKALTHFEPDVIGLSVVIPEAAVLRGAVRCLKVLAPRAKIVVGGPYAISSTLEVLGVPAIDAVVCGEGEAVLPRLVAAWAAGAAQPVLPGVGYPGVGLGPAPEPIADLDALPFPAWELVEFDTYHRQPRHGYLYRNREYFSVLTSRGCPYHCTFCQALFGHRYRMRSPKCVVDEVEALYRQHGIREIHFVDDCFNLDLPRAKAICDEIVHRDLDIGITFPAGLRADAMDCELIDKLAAAGTFKIPYGIETASLRLQKMLKKNVNLAKLSVIIDHTVRRGIIAQGFFMLGFPTETETEVQQTIRFALDSNLHLATFNHVNLLPGTELWKMAAQLGRTDGYDPANCDYDDPPVSLSEVPPSRMKALAQQANIRFYLNVWRLWRIWRALPRKRHFFGFFGLFLGKLTWFGARNRKQ
jgi:anaerobic magnesium-protoporphyrin IX monomethyl ester cyclase